MIDLELNPVERLAIADCERIHGPGSWMRRIAARQIFARSGKWR